MKNLLKCGLALAAAFSLAACSGGSQSEDTTKIGIIQLAEHPALDQAYEGFMDGLKDIQKRIRHLIIKTHPMIYPTVIQLRKSLSMMAMI